MSNQIEQAYEDDGSEEWLEANDDSQALHAQTVLYQQQEEDFSKLLDNDPGYHAWATALELEDRDYIDHIERLAEAELERMGGGMTIEAWDRV